MPIRHERSVVHPPWLRIRWGWIAVVAFVLLCSASVWGAGLFPMMLVLLIAWILWRGERDAGRH